MKAEGPVSVTSGNQRDAITNEYWNDTDDQFVDGIFVEKGRDDVAAAHHPNVLARLRSQACYERANRFRYEFDARRE